MNEVQKVVFDMFEHFADVCNRLGLKYYLVNGSALGSKKYGGFIAWDDDMDVAMPREDYEVFLSKAQELLPEEIFVQNYRTDPAFPFMYTKLRNSNTTFIEASVKKLNINHGIYLDLFPLDGYEDESGISSRIKKLKIKILHWFHFCALDDKSSFKIRIRNFVFRVFGFHKRTAKSLEKLERIVSNSENDSKYLCNYSDRQGKGCILREWYGKGSVSKFEGAEVIIPENFESYFTKKYGDWRAELPENEQKSHHKAYICDVTKSYTEYINNQ